MTWVNPLTGRITSGYQTKSRPDHAGTDIAPKAGIIYAGAACEGTVKSTRTNSYPGDKRAGLLPLRTGNGVILEHGDGIMTYYGHLEDVLVKPGQKVTAGENLGRVGQTGNATGVHLHYEVHTNGHTTNPTTWNRKHGAPLGTGRPYPDGKPSSKPKPSSSDKTLKRGDSGPRVAALQRELNLWKSALPKLLVDGEYGPVTERRVREWQKRNHGGVYPRAARIDGIAGPITLDGLGF